MRRWGLFSDVYVYSSNNYTYPTKDSLFRPSKKYPEYLFDDLSDENAVYGIVRESFHNIGYDKENFGSEAWNPLGFLIKPGNSVLIKPNIVMDHNLIEQNGTDCLITNPSIVAAIIDYVCIALKGTGKIVIGDAPMQECNFDKLIEESGYSDLVKWYRNKGIDISLVDFRELKSKVKKGIHVQSISKETRGIIVDLGPDSEFSRLKSDDYSRLRVTNYDPSILITHHTPQKNEYYINECVLKSDVIINVPKPKTHRKAGVTIAMKNLIGINARKEFLPHHTLGSKDENGDEYLKKDFVHACRSKLLDRMNYNSFNGKVFFAQIDRVIIKLFRLLKKTMDFTEGSWYGNHTISKTIIDLNKILIYADKNGVMHDTPQRKNLIVADMIISGEKEGPVAPSKKNVGVIAIGSNQVCFDEVVATVMGFDYKKIPTIVNARSTEGKYPLCKHLIPRILSNSANFNEKRINEIEFDDTYKYEPTSGWKKHIEL